jgi:hypothetical protein
MTRQLSVGLDGATPLCLTLGERRRIQDNQIELRRRPLLQPLKGVCLHHDASAFELEFEGLALAA